MNLLAKFEGLCPNCGGEVEAERLEKGFVCSKCLPHVVSKDKLCEALLSAKKLIKIENLCRIKELTKEFEEFFKEKFGFPPWSLQKTWAKRAFSGKSFALIAPTGVGKTTFAVAMAAFSGGKSYIILPTRVLVQQVASRLEGICSKKVLAYMGTGPKTETLKERIKAGDFDVLITTNAFLNRNFEELLKGKVFDFLFVDDVDSVLKSSRNVDYLFYLIGIDEATIRLALKHTLTEEEKRKLEEGKKKIKGKLIVSTATAKPKTGRVNLFSRLLGFEVQRAPTVIRNVVDVMERLEGEFEEVMDRAVQVVKKVGDGCLVYLPTDRGREKVKDMVSRLIEAGIPAVSYEDFDLEAQEKFVKGEIKAAVGVSHSHNPLVRGIDLPQAVKAAVFAGIPKMMFPVELSLKPSHLFSMLLALRPLMEDKEKVDTYVAKLRGYLTLSEEKLNLYPRIKAFVEEVYEFLSKWISRPDFRAKVEESDEVSLKEENGKYYVVVADAASYLQASGRTSRLFPGGVTLGLSYLLSEDRKAEKSLLRRLKLLDPDLRFLSPEEVDFSRILTQIKAQRDLLKDIREGRRTAELKDVIKTCVVAVESPTKARTIANFFGKPTRKWVEGVPVYEVNAGDRIINIVATLGHITDLVVGKGLYGVERVDGRLCPLYATLKKCKDGSTTTEDCPGSEGVEYDKKSIIEALRQLSMESDEVYLATDPDSEGEKISWDLYLLLKPYNSKINRAEFHEVTRRAFLKALKEPRSIDTNLVGAQFARRIADRWVGFFLSQQVQRRFKNRHLSAGRVQSPVLGWIIERERQRRKKKALLTLHVGGRNFTLEQEDLSLARRIYEQATTAEIVIEEEFEKELSPPPPFTTDALILESSEKLHFPASKTMELAQELFEKGLITYHRTDSTRVSEAGYKVAGEFVEENFGKEVLQLRSWTAEGAHECIRPTRPIDRDTLRFLVSQGVYELDSPREALRLYDLIFRRFIASQMKKAKVQVVKGKLKVLEHHQDFEVYSRVLFPGYTLMLPLKVEKVEKGILEIESRQIRIVPSVLPFSQGKLIEEMKRKGIGRPSTYAKIVNTLLERGYVVDRKNFLYPTRLGFNVFTFLNRNYPLYCDEDFTRLLEEEMDLIEEGKRSVEEVIDKIIKSGGIEKFFS